MLERPRPCTILCFNVHTTVENLNKNISIGQLLKCSPNSIVVSAGSRPKRQKQKQKQKHITKKFVRFHNHCLQLTMAKGKEKSRSKLMDKSLLDKYLFK